VSFGGGNLLGIVLIVLVVLLLFGGLAGPRLGLYRW
jgi:hypothetical protein